VSGWCGGAIFFYAAALRQAGGERQFARDAALSVLPDLARKAPMPALDPFWKQVKHALVGAVAECEAAVQTPGRHRR